MAMFVSIIQVMMWSSSSRWVWLILQQKTKQNKFSGYGKWNEQVNIVIIHFIKFKSPVIEISRVQLTLAWWWQRKTEKREKKREEERRQIFFESKISSNLSNRWLYVPVHSLVAFEFEEKPEQEFQQGKN